MKIKDGFAKREIAGSNIVVPVGNSNNTFNGMITLNDSGSFFWDCFMSDSTVEEVVNKVCDTYEVDKETATNDVNNFVNMLKKNNLID